MARGLEEGRGERFAARNNLPDSLERPTEVVENVAIARDTYRVRWGAQLAPKSCRPVSHAAVARTDDPLWGLRGDVRRGLDRGQPWGVDVVYLAVGKLTRRLAACRAGDRLEVWGPLGNGFQPTKAEHLVMVAGGIGQTPFYALGQEALGRSYGRTGRPRHAVSRVTLCYGAKTVALLAGIDDFRSVGVEVQVATDDGSAGHHGLVTELIEPLVGGSGSAASLVCCGPEPMLKAISQIARRLGVPCQVSLETPMACGMGICFSCVTKVRDGRGGWDYRRTWLRVRYSTRRRSSSIERRAGSALFQGADSGGQRDLSRAAALGWITLRAPARSSLLAARRNSASAFSTSAAWTASRTLRTWLLTALRIERFLARRSTFWRSRFLALLVLGMSRFSDDPACVFSGFLSHCRPTKSGRAGAKPLILSALGDLVQ